MSKIIPTTTTSAIKTRHNPLPTEKTSEFSDGRGNGADSKALAVRTDSQLITQLQHWSAMERVLAILGNLLWASLPAVGHPL